MAKAKLNNELIATVTGDITVFNYDGETREYISSSVEYLAEGVGIPALSCIDAPGEIKEGFTICRTFDLNGWEYIADHRGKTVYSTKSGRKSRFPYRVIIRKIRRHKPLERHMISGMAASG
jgi:hypothetical protein